MESWINQTAERLFLTNGSEGFPDLFAALLRALVNGRPVTPQALAAIVGWPVPRVTTALQQAPGTEYDSNGNIVGYGLTLRETQHVFEIGDQRLYTWCALDTLMFPVLLGQSARVISRCASTGAPIFLTVAPDKVLAVEPAGATVSLVQPDASTDIRRSFCCHVNFFASAAAGDSWVSQHEGGKVLTVADAFEVGQELARRMPQAAHKRFS